MGTSPRLELRYGPPPPLPPTTEPLPPAARRASRESDRTSSTSCGSSPQLREADNPPSEVEEVLVEGVVTDEAASSRRPPSLLSPTEQQVEEQLELDRVALRMSRIRKLRSERVSQPSMATTPEQQVLDYASALTPAQQEDRRFAALRIDRIRAEGSKRSRLSQLPDIPPERMYGAQRSWLEDRRRWLEKQDSDLNPDTVEGEVRSARFPLAVSTSASFYPMTAGTFRHRRTRHWTAMQSLKMRQR